MSRLVSTMVMCVVTLYVGGATHAATIIKLGLSTDSLPDIQLVNGTLGTAVDAVGATLGEQNTEVTFLGALSGISLVEGANASFTLSNIQLEGPPTVIGTTLLQRTTGGTFALYDPSNNLMLAGTLGNGTLSGPIGGTATGGFLTTEFGEFTGGSLLTSLTQSNRTRSSFSISLTNVNDGLGLTLRETGEVDDFQADATANIGAQPAAVPEPGSWLLLIAAGLALFAAVRDRTSL